MTLSKRATALLHRLYEGHFYRTFDTKQPKAMQELIDNRLVYVDGRIFIIGSCYVPNGHKPFQIDEMPPKPEWLCGKTKVVAEDVQGHEPRRTKSAAQAAARHPRRKAARN